ncbi:MAG TPA: hypothetical protein VGR96_14985 [Acidobacteriaceae bacterium]|nr:hypothetical protein [Acidobacteriaceae bacterium]
MKTLVRGILLTGVLAMGAGSFLVAQPTTNSPTDQWYRAKFGHPSPAEQARIDEYQASTAYREEAPAASPGSVHLWLDQWYRAKFGHPSPAEQARINEYQSSTAYREQATAPSAASVQLWLDQWYRAKFGHPSPAETGR